MYEKQKLYPRIALFAIVLLFVVGYAYYRTVDLIRGPEVTIETPQDGETVSTAFISIEGTARNIKEISLNGGRIFVDENGAFEEKMLLAYGYNVIEVGVQDKFGRSIKKVLHLVYK